MASCTCLFLFIFCLQKCNANLLHGVWTNILKSNNVVNSWWSRNKYEGEQWRECSERTPRGTGPRIVAGTGERKSSQEGTRNEIWSSNRNCEVTWEVKHVSHGRNISLSQWKALEFAWRSELFIQRKSQPQHIQDKVCTRHMLCELSQGHSISEHFCDSFWFHCDFFFFRFHFHRPWFGSDERLENLSCKGYDTPKVQLKPLVIQYKGYKPGLISI